MQRDERPATSAQIEYARDLILKLGYDLDWYDLEKMTRGQIKGRVGGLTMEKLKPCPFCGGEAVMGKTLDKKNWIVKCNTCRYWLIPADRVNKTDMVRIWNRRAEDDKC